MHRISSYMFAHKNDLQPTAHSELTFQAPDENFLEMNNQDLLCPTFLDAINTRGANKWTKIVMETRGMHAGEKKISVRTKQSKSVKIQIGSSPGFPSSLSAVLRQHARKKCIKILSGSESVASSYSALLISGVFPSFSGGGLYAIASRSAVASAFAVAFAIPHLAPLSRVRHGPKNTIPVHTRPHTQLQQQQVFTN